MLVRLGLDFFGGCLSFLWFLYQFPVTLKPLARFEGGEREGNGRGILFSLQDYLQLVDQTGRVLRPGKRGAIAETQLPILERLGLDFDDWLSEATEFEARYQANQRAHHRRRRTAA